MASDARFTYTTDVTSHPLRTSMEEPNSDYWATQVYSPSTGVWPLKQYLCCSSMASRESSMTGLLRASITPSHVGLSVDVNQAFTTSLSWSPGSSYWTLMQSKVLMSTWSWMPRLYHLARHRKVSLRMVLRSAILNGAPEMIDVKKQVLIQALKLKQVAWLVDLGQLPTTIWTGDFLRHTIYYPVVIYLLGGRKWGPQSGQWWWQLLSRQNFCF